MEFVEEKIMEFRIITENLNKVRNQEMDNIILRTEPRFRVFRSGVIWRLDTEKGGG